jgi:hypothetical protein
MIISEKCRSAVATTLLSIFVAACSHQSAPSAQISNGLAPFSSARNQTVALIAGTKHSLGAADLNSLAVTYTQLQQKANAYADFMVETVMTRSFDPNRNAHYAADFAQSIAAFDKAYEAVVASSRPVISGAWVASFAQTLQDRWNRYNGLLATMSPQTKANLIAAVKRETVWPNYENIATESVASSR